MWHSHRRLLDTSTAHSLVQMFDSSAFLFTSAARFSLLHIPTCSCLIFRLEYDNVLRPKAKLRVSSSARPAGAMARLQAASLAELCITPDLLNSSSSDVVPSCNPCPHVTTTQVDGNAPSGIQLRDDTVELRSGYKRISDYDNPTHVVRCVEAAAVPRLFLLSVEIFTCPNIAPVVLVVTVKNCDFRCCCSYRFNCCHIATRERLLLPRSCKLRRHRCHLRSAGIRNLSYHCCILKKEGESVTGSARGK